MCGMCETQVNLNCIMWTLFSTVGFSIPMVLPVTKDAMDYTAVITVSVILAGTWFILGCISRFLSSPLLPLACPITSMHFDPAVDRHHRVSWRMTISTTRTTRNGWSRRFRYRRHSQDRLWRVLLTVPLVDSRAAEVEASLDAESVETSDGLVTCPCPCPWFGRTIPYIESFIGFGASLPISSAPFTLDGIVVPLSPPLMYLYPFCFSVIVLLNHR